MWDLEYLMLFGLPNNKMEMIDGKCRWVFPFLDRANSEAHFEAWLKTLCRWKDLPYPPAVVKEGGHWRVNGVNTELELCPLPITLHLPVNGKVFRAIYGTFWRRDLWPGQPADRTQGYDHFLDNQDVRMKLQWWLQGINKRHGGLSSGRVAIALSDTAAVEPDAYYYAQRRKDCMIRGDYFRGPPGLIAEVLTPPSRAWDRGTRMELYARHGVHHLWLVDPPVETVEVYELDGRSYRPTRTYGCGGTFRCALFPDEQIEVAPLFETQRKHHRAHWGEEDQQEEPQPVPEWLAPPEVPLGLEYLFYMGHPEHRWEIWNNRAPNVLAFGSAAEARLRFRHFLTEMCRWEQQALPGTWTQDADAEQVEVGRFRLTRRGRLVYLDVAVDARKYREMLEVWSRREAWDWGE